MAAIDFSVTQWVAIADVVVLAAAGSGLVALRRLRPVAAPDMQSAFQILERYIGRYAVGVPLGYTWREAFEWLKGEGVGVDWAGAKARLEEYEAFRYGGRSLPSGGQDEVISLAQRLRRGRIAKRP